MTATCLIDQIDSFAEYPPSLQMSQLLISSDISWYIRPRMSSPCTSYPDMGSRPKWHAGDAARLSALMEDTVDSCAKPSMPNRIPPSADSSLRLGQACRALIESFVSRSHHEMSSASSECRQHRRIFFTPVHNRGARVDFVDHAIKSSRDDGIQMVVGQLTAEQPPGLFCSPGRCKTNVYSCRMVIDHLFSHLLSLPAAPTCSTSFNAHCSSCPLKMEACSWTTYSAEHSMQYNTIHRMSSSMDP